MAEKKPKTASVTEDDSHSPQSEDTPLVKKDKTEKKEKGPEAKPKKDDAAKARSQSLKEKKGSQKALAKEEARSMMEGADEQMARKEKAKQKGRTRKDTIQSTKSYTPSLETLTERNSEKNMEDLLTEEEKAEILAVSKSQELPVKMTTSRDFDSPEEKCLSHEDIPEFLRDLGEQMGVRNGTASTIRSNSSLNSASISQLNIAGSPNKAASNNSDTIFPKLKPGERPMAEVLSTDFSDTEAETDFETAKNRRDLAKETRYRRLRTSSHCDALRDVPLPEKPKRRKWAKFFRRKQQDHRHEMFVRLDELCHGPTGDVRWQEKARWIKFEEDVEEEAHRWGKPHLASISFRSMVDLRKCLKKGAVLLDIEEEDLNSIAQRIAEQLVYIDQLEPECKKPLLKVLLKKHRHTDDKKNFIRRRSFSVSKSARPMSTGSVKSLKTNGKAAAPDRQTSTVSSQPSCAGEYKIDVGLPDVAFTRHQDHVRIDLDDMASKITSIEELNTSQNNNKKDDPSTVDFAINEDEVFDDSSAGVHFNAMLARILKGAEATSVMVGTLGIINNPVCAFVRLSEARPLKGLTEVALPIRFLFLLLVPPGDNVDHYEVGRAISALMANPMFRDAMYDAENRADILDAILDYLDDSIVLPPGEWDKKTLLPIINMAKKKKSGKTEKSEDDKGSTDLAPPPEDTLDDPLRRTKRPFGGLVNDIKRRYPKYLSDIKDGLNLQCFATILFIYFACLSPAITFGGLLTEKTERWLGVTEMLVGVSLCGLTFSLVSGQPMLIVGATGPLLVFEEALFQICGLMGVDFISLRVWVGIWVTIITLLVVALEGSFLIHYFTRFIHEIFAALISLILILETLKKLFLIFVYHPLSQFYPDPNPNLTMCLEMADNATLREVYSFSSNDTTSSHADDHDKVVNQPNTALLSMILCFGTFFIAYSLRSFKTSKFLGKHARHVIGDFAIPIAILIMVTLDYFINDTYTEKLDVPDGLKPTDSNKRGWFINPLGSSEASLPVWGMFFAIIPALLMFILVFMETEVTTMILDQKDRQLRKGSGYHLDLLLVGSFATISGLVGFPFVCPATLRSISHISALSVFSATQAPGEKPQLLEVKEQRITAFGVHILLGVSVLMGPLLRLVPIAVLFGVFFYMGVVAMHGLQMVDRVKYMFMPVKHHPDIGYVTRVRTFKMNLFTVIQLSCLALLGVIKFTKAALAFPFVLLMLVPLRLFVLKLFFTDTELRELDNEESGSSEEVARQAGEISEDDEEEDNEGGTGGGGGDDDIYRPISTPVN